MPGRKVAAHAHGVDGINAALRAGVASIEHGTFTNDETFRLYRQTGHSCRPCSPPPRRWPTESAAR